MSKSLILTYAFGIPPREFLLKEAEVKSFRGFCKDKGNLYCFNNYLVFQMHNIEKNDTTRGITVMQISEIARPTDVPGKVYENFVFIKVKKEMKMKDGTIERQFKFKDLETKNAFRDKILEQHDRINRIGR